MWNTIIIIITIFYKYSDNSIDLKWNTTFRNFFRISSEICFRASKMRENATYFAIRIIVDEGGGVFGVRNAKYLLKIFRGGRPA